MNAFLNLIVLIFQYIFVRKEFYSFFKVIYLFAIRGLGLFNYQNSYLSGEMWLLKKISAYYEHKKCDIIIFDVGANRGEYLRMVTNDKILRSSQLFAFEPNPACYKYLKKTVHKENIVLVECGLGKEEEEVYFYDDYNHKASGHASMYEEVVSEIQKEKVSKIKVRITTIDKVSNKMTIPYISLLKIDTEGNEYSILLGAKKMLIENKIDFIQFEFNSMNVVSRVYFRDFFKLLDKYSLYRLLPNGLVRIDSYDPIFCEMFGFQNILAVKNTILFP